MNIIQKQAEHFYSINMRESRTKYQPFVDEVKSALFNYRKAAHKLEFLQWIISKLKQDFDKHFEVCTDKGNCIINETYENAIFFLQIELEEIEDSLSDLDFSSTAKTEMDDKLNEILNQLKLLNLGQEIIYDDISSKLEELKSFYFLDKKTWKQLLFGKLKDYTTAGMVAEGISLPILDILKQF